MSLYEIIMKAGRRAEVHVYSVIGESFWGEETVDAKTFVKELKALDVDEIDLRINSPGGSVFDGTAIVNALDRHPAKVTAYVDGFAGSMATVVMLASEKVVMASNAYLMIHLPSGGAWGTAEDLRTYAESLDKIEKVMIATYAKKSGQDEATVRAALTKETWFTADEALEWGLVDEVSEAMDIAACASYGADALGMMHIRKAPAALVAALQQTSSAGHPGRPSSTTTNEEDTMDPKLAAIRDALGMPETATEDEIRARAMEELAAPAGDENGDKPTEAPVTAPTEDDKGEDDPEKPATPAEEPNPAPAPTEATPGAVLIDANVLAQLQAGASAGLKAEEARMKAEREELVMTAVREGRIPLASKGEYLKALAGPAEASTRKLLTASPAEGGLAPGLIPVSEIGSSVDVDATGTAGAVAYDEGLFPEVVAKKARMAAGDVSHPLIAREG